MPDDLVSSRWSPGTAPLAASPPAASPPAGSAAAAGSIPRDLDSAAAAIAAGERQTATELVWSALARDPDHPRALGMLGQLLSFAGRHEAALAPLQRAAARDGRLEFRIWLCLCLERLGRRAEALGLLGEIVDNVPQTANAHFAVGMVLERVGCAEHAVRLFERCVALDPGRADARHRLGRTLHALGRFEPAIEAFEEAIRRCDTDASCFADLSAVLSNLGRFERANEAGRIAVGLDGRCAEACNNVGHALLNLNRSTEAVGWYERAIAIREDYATARFGHAVALLKSGDFRRGWREYEWRWRDCQTARGDLDVPRWQGEVVTGQTILLHAEQGLGDTLQFVRFAAAVAARGARVVLEVPQPLVRLLRAVQGVSAVVACGDALPPVDLHCPLASLPMLLDLDTDTIPGAPYLPRRAANPAGSPAGSLGRAAGSGLVVGLVWAGDPRREQLCCNLVDRRRSATLALLSPLLDVEGVRFQSFQLGEARQEVANGSGVVVDAMEGVADFADTAARLQPVDLLISVDTSMAHLAGGMGMPVWMLSRHDGCWRWLEGRNDTPWYPSMRIFRQRSQGDWAGVVDEVRAALLDRVAGQKSGVVSGAQ